MKWIFAVYSRYVRVSFNSAAAYRADFFVTALISLLVNMLSPLMTALIYAGGAEIPGWTLAEALMIQSVYILCTGVCAPLFYSMIWINMDHIREGTFDLVLLKPGSPAFLVAAASFDIGNIGMLVGGIAMFTFSLLNLPTPPGIMQWLAFILLLFMGLCMTLGCILLVSATTFKWIGNSRIFEIYDAVTMFGRYPGTIFGRTLQGVSAFVIPVAMMGYFPAAAIMGRATTGMLLAAIPCAAFLLLGWFVFKRMIHLYQSAGG
jgi:ABC-2 type transport system permease protein